MNTLINASLILMGVGMGTVFLALAIFFALIWGLERFSRHSKE